MPQIFYEWIKFTSANILNAPHLFACNTAHWTIFEICGMYTSHIPSYHLHLYCTSHLSSVWDLEILSFFCVSPPYSHLHLLFLQIQILFTHQCKIYYMINTRKCIPYCIPKNIFQLICVTRLTAWRMWRDIIITTKTTIRLEWRRSQIFCAHLLFSHSTIYPCILNALMHICTSQDNHTF